MSQDRLNPVKAHVDPIKPSNGEPPKKTSTALELEIERLGQKAADNAPPPRELDLIRERFSSYFGDKVRVDVRPAFGGEPSHYTIMGFDNFDPNKIIEQYPVLGKQELWNEIEHVERWVVSKTLAQSLTPKIRREQHGFVKLTDQIVTSLKQEFLAMKKAHFSGESENHYTIDGVAITINDLQQAVHTDPREVFTQANEHDSANFQRIEGWKLRVPSELMHQALELPPPGNMTKDFAKAYRASHRTTPATRSIP